MPHPGSSPTPALGVSASKWASINDAIFFPDDDVAFTNAGNVGINTDTPTSKFHVVGDSYFGGVVTITGALTLTNGIKIGTNNDNCDDDTDRGSIRFKQGVSDDELQICMKINSSHVWRSASTTPASL